jgi:hypothetical protein
MSSLTSDLKRLLRQAGCHLDRQGGKHEIWYSPLTNRHFAVPRTVKRVATANSILRDAGLPKAF